MECTYYPKYIQLVILWGKEMLQILRLLRSTMSFDRSFGEKALFFLVKVRCILLLLASAN